jgi:hypothetical protein
MTVSAQRTEKIQLFLDDEGEEEQSAGKKFVVCTTCSILDQLGFLFGRRRFCSNLLTEPELHRGEAIYGNLNTGAWFTDFIEEFWDFKVNHLDWVGIYIVYLNLICCCNDTVLVEQECIPVALEVYCDSFGVTNTRSSTGIYVGVSNLDISQKTRLENKMLYCLTPPGVDFMACVDNLLKDIDLLEKGVVTVWHAAKDTRVRLWGRVAITIGDMPASNKMNGYLGPGAVHPCRRCLLNNVSFNEPDCLRSESHGFPNNLIRDADVIMETLTRGHDELAKGYGHKGTAQDIFQEAGLSQNINDYKFICNFHNYDATKQSPNDTMHLDVLNNWSRHIRDCFMPKLSLNIRRRISDAVSTYPAMFNLPALSNGCMDTTNWTASEWLSLSHMILPAARRQAPLPMVQLLAKHCKVLRWLGAQKISASNLVRLEKDYTDVLLGVQKMYPDCCSWQMPTHHAPVHWGFYIRHFGTPMHYSATRWEAVHQDFKRDSGHVSGRAARAEQYTKHHLTRTEATTLATLHDRLHTPTSYKLMKPLMQTTDLEELAPGLTKCMAKLLRSSSSRIAGTVDCYRSMSHHDVVYHTGDSVRMKNDEMSWFVGQITHILTFSPQSNPMSMITCFAVHWFSYLRNDQQRDKMTDLEHMKLGQLPDLFDVKDTFFYKVFMFPINDASFLLVDVPAGHRGIQDHLDFSDKFY